MEISKEFSLDVPLKLGNRYRIVSLLGRGTTSCVYKALDLALDLPVCVKVFNPILFKGDFREINLLRIYRARAYQHECLVKIFEFQEDYEWVFLTSELIEGISLRTLLDIHRESGEQFNLPKIRNIVQKILNGLKFIHKLGVHGNLKPENIFILPKTLKLTDPYYLINENFLKTKELPLSEYYRAPEQYKKPTEELKSSDIYSLALIIGELIAGSAVQPGILLSEQIPLLSKRLDSLFIKCTAENASERLSSIIELAAQLQKIFEKLEEEGLWIRRYHETGAFRPLPKFREEKKEEEHFLPPMVEEKIEVAEEVTEKEIEGIVFAEEFKKPSIEESLLKIEEKEEAIKTTTLMEKIEEEVGVEEEKIEIEKTEVELKKFEISEEGIELEEEKPLEEKEKIEFVPEETIEEMEAKVEETPSAPVEVAKAEVMEFVPLDESEVEVVAEGIEPEIMEEEIKEEILIESAREFEESEEIIELEEVEEELPEITEAGSEIEGTPTIKTSTLEEVAQVVLSYEETAKSEVIEEVEEASKIPAPSIVEPRKEEKAFSLKIAATLLIIAAITGGVAALLYIKFEKSLFSTSKKVLFIEKKDVLSPPLAVIMEEIKEEDFEEEVFFEKLPMEPSAEIIVEVEPSPDEITPSVEEEVKAIKILKATDIRCPEGMKRIIKRSEIPYSPDVKASALGYCIDFYEYPGRGAMPKVNVTKAEAFSICKREGKRLCTNQEWRRACGGKYPYGESFKPGVCNTATEDGLEKPVMPSGSFQTCKSPYGIYDMSGNVSEWTANGSVAGGDGSKLPESCTCNNLPKRFASSRSSYVGFRCCADPEFISK